MRYRIVPVFKGKQSAPHYKIQVGDYHGDGTGMDAYDWEDVENYSYTNLDNAKYRITELLEMEKDEREFIMNNKPFMYP